MKLHWIDATLDDGTCRLVRAKFGDLQVGVVFWESRGGWVSMPQLPTSTLEQKCQTFPTREAAQARLEAFVTEWDKHWMELHA